MYDCWQLQRWIFRIFTGGRPWRVQTAGLGWGEAFEVSRHSLRTIPFDSMSFAGYRIEAGIEELTHDMSRPMQCGEGRKVDVSLFLARLS